VDELGLFNVKLRVTTLSQPAVFVPVHVAELFDAVNVCPCHVYEIPQVTMVSVDELGLFNVKLRVTTLSQPAAFVPVHVAELFDAVNVCPCHVYEVPQVTMVSVDELGLFNVKLRVTTLSQPAAFVPVHVAELLDVVNVWPCHV
jgi:hypothetical protein